MVVYAEYHIRWKNTLFLRIFFQTPPLPKFEAVEGAVITPDIFGMCVPDSPDGNLIQPLKGITTATHIFDEISIAIVKPLPKIIDTQR